MIKGNAKKGLRYVSIFIKLVFVPSVLGLLAYRFVSGSPLALAQADPSLLVAGLLINQLALSFFALRMRVMLGVFGIKISYGQSLRIHLQSMFYFFALPMTLGLEAARFAKIKTLVGERSPTLALGSALVTDRLVGAFAAFMLAVILLPFMKLDLSAQGDMRFSLAIAASVCGALFLLFLHKKIRSYIKELAALILSGRKGLWAAIVIALMTHLLFAFGVYLAALSVPMPITFIQTLFIISSAMLFVIFPVSFAGAGPVEAATFGVLYSLGVPMEHAAIFVLIAYAAKLLAAFEGGGWELYEGGGYVSRWLLGTRKEKTRKEG